MTKIEQIILKNDNLIKIKTSCEEDSWIFVGIPDEESLSFMLSSKVGLSHGLATSWKNIWQDAKIKEQRSYGRESTAFVVAVIATESNKDVKNSIKYAKMSNVEKWRKKQNRQDALQNDLNAKINKNNLHDVENEDDWAVVSRRNDITDKYLITILYDARRRDPYADFITVYDTSGMSRHFSTCNLPESLLRGERIKSEKWLDQILLRQEELKVIPSYKDWLEGYKGSEMYWSIRYDARKAKSSFEDVIKVVDLEEQHVSHFLLNRFVRPVVPSKPYNVEFSTLKSVTHIPLIWLLPSGVMNEAGLPNLKINAQGGRVDVDTYGGGRLRMGENVSCEIDAPSVHIGQLFLSSDDADAFEAMEETSLEDVRQKLEDENGELSLPTLLPLLKAVSLKITSTSTRVVIDKISVLPKEGYSGDSAAATFTPGE